MKPRVMSLVLFTSFVGLVIAPTSVEFDQSFFALLAVAIGAGAAGTLNMWYESDIDAVMSRTCLRPIPTGMISKKQALFFGTALSLISIVMLYQFSNFLSAALLALTIGFYFFVYTIWLKKRTPQNIVIGGAAGALPPVIGWTIATNYISIEPIILFLLIFLWTPSHFWALSLYKSKDYQKAKIPMLPLVSGVEYTKKNIFFYALIMFPVALAPYYLNFASKYFLMASSLLSGYYMILCYELLIKQKQSEIKKTAKKIFVYSIFYLFIIFLTLLIDNIL